MFLQRLQFFVLSAVACLGCTDNELATSPKMVATAPELQIVPPSMTDVLTVAQFRGPEIS